MRLLLFGLMVEQVAPDRLLEFTRDVKQYTTSANAIREQFDFDTEGVVLFGPGYPTFLALLGFVLSPHPYLLILVQILISAVGSVLVAMFAFELTPEREISFVAGLLNSLSLTSITLANILLSETAFFALMALGFFLFIRGLKKEKVVYFLLTALVLSMAALIRSVGQFLFLILLVIAVVYAWPAGGLRTFARKLTWPLVTAGLIVTVVAAWTVRNERLYGFSQVAFAAPTGIAKLVSLTRADIDGSSYEEASLTFAKEVERLQADSMSYYRAFAIHTRNCMHRLVREHPESVAKIFFGNVINEINNEWGLQYKLLPRWSDPLRGMTSWIYKKGLNYRVSLLAAIGVIILLRQKKYRLLIVLLSIYSYFALLAGFTHWQSSRIFYPGQLAWAILIAYPLFSLYKRFVRKVRLT